MRNQGVSPAKFIQRLLGKSRIGNQVVLNIAIPYFIQNMRIQVGAGIRPAFNN